MCYEIFLADDELNVRHALRLLLEQAGYMIVGEAWDAESLRAGICGLSPVVILLDWELPALKVQCCRIIERAHSRGVKVVALSARPDARLNALAVGVDAFVSKGNPPEDLLTVLRGITVEDR